MTLQPVDRYTCPICDFATGDPAIMAAHQVDRHGHTLPAPILRDVRLVEAGDLLEDHLARLLKERERGEL